MLNTVHTNVRLVAQQLAAQGVRQVVLCPGSRNAPLCVAFERHGGITTHVVIDERCAAFIALGMAVESGGPVAVVCTSGTAPLNFAPALAEAYYRNVPLVAVTADRPEKMIDCLDSQTIRQPGIFTNYIKGTFDISDDSKASEMIVRAVQLALTPFRGPVHINVRIDEPIGTITEVTDEDIPSLRPGNICPAAGDVLPDIPPLVASRAILVIASCASPDSRIGAALRRLAACGNVMVVQDAVSNTTLDSSQSITAPDVFFARHPSIAPEYVLTIGGAPISGTMKKYLRGLNSLRHWSIGQPGHPDTFGALEKSLHIGAAVFLNALADALIGIPGSLFRRQWFAQWQTVRRAADHYIGGAPFTGLQAVCKIMESLPAGTHLHLSNGMSVRYAQYAGYPALARVDCNRGVSGIDGCTSTAIGAALCTSAPVVMISGDMSAQYDIGALATYGIPANFKMAVLSNGGGNIFRHIDATRHLDELERCLVGQVRLPLEILSGAFGFGYFRAGDSRELSEAIGPWLAHSGPAVMEIVTDGPRDAENYRNLIKYVKEELDND